MADIQERINKIGGLFKEMQVKQVDDTSVIYVVVQFPNKWIIDEQISEKFNVSVIDGNGAPGEYYFCAEMATGFDTVFDAIDFCIRSNKEAMERAKIFQEKLLILKEMFGNEDITLEELKGLEIVPGKVRKKAVPKKKTPLEEIAEKELEEKKE